MKKTPYDESIKEKTKKVWGVSPAGSFYGKDLKKGTKEFFEKVVDCRIKYECQWLEDVIDFRDFKNKEVLEVGCGAGFDAYSFCKNKASYTGIDITKENIEITKKHLLFYGFTPNILEMDAENMSFKNSFDFVYSFGVLHHIPNDIKVMENINNALKPNGECLIIVYNKNSFFYWISLFLFDWIFYFGFLKEPFLTRLRRIEYTLSNEMPYVKAYTKKQLRHLFKTTGFDILDIKVRKMNAEDLPRIPFSSSLYKVIPRSFLNYLGKIFGWYICVKAKKINSCHE